jgi:hypothetical protein
VISAVPRWRWAALGVALAVNLVILYSPQAPGPAALGGVPGLDKVVHVATFGVLAWAGLRAGLMAGWWLPLLAAHAVLSEIVQHELLPHRSGDPLDVVADIVGVLAGSWSAWASWRGDRTGSRRQPDGTPARGDPGPG